MLILHFICTCITSSFLPMQLFMSFRFFATESAMPSNLYFKSMHLSFARALLCRLFFLSATLSLL